MNDTQNYHLPQFEETDRIHHDDFNDAFSAIDAALAEKPYVIGTYTGDGALEEDGGQHITLGFEAAFVLVTHGGESGFYRYSAVIMRHESGASAMLTNDGFTTWDNCYGGGTGNLNEADTDYWFVAFR